MKDFAVLHGHGQVHASRYARIAYNDSMFNSLIDGQPKIVLQYVWFRYLDWRLPFEQCKNRA